jgi:hypothetical protein
LAKDEEIWWSAKEAAAEVGCDPETIRNWGRSEKVAIKQLPGQRRRLMFLAKDVLAHAGKSGRSRRPDEEISRLRAMNASLVDRNVILEEVMRRYRLIDERRDEIDRWHRDIEELLQGTAPVPNQ